MTSENPNRLRDLAHHAEELYFKGLTARQAIKVVKDHHERKTNSHDSK